MKIRIISTSAEGFLAEVLASLSGPAREQRWADLAPLAVMLTPLSTTMRLSFASASLDNRRPGAITTNALRIGGCLIVRAFGAPAHFIKLSPETITGHANESLDLRFEACCLQGVGHTLLSRMH
jgi:hypothetical protein